MDDFMDLWGFAGERIVAHIPSVSYDEGMDEVESVEDVVIDDVLFGTPTAEEIANAERMHGARAGYKLCIPRECGIVLSGSTITRERDGSTWAVIADGPQLPPELTPTRWNREVLVAREDG